MSNQITSNQKITESLIEKHEELDKFFTDRIAQNKLANSLTEEELAQRQVILDKISKAFSVFEKEILAKS